MVKSMVALEGFAITVQNGTRYSSGHIVSSAGFDRVTILHFGISRFVTRGGDRAHDFGDRRVADHLKSVRLGLRCP